VGFSCGVVSWYRKYFQVVVWLVSANLKVLEGKEVVRFSDFRMFVKSISMCVSRKHKNWESLRYYK
jgi:hypothetical protein